MKITHKLKNLLRPVYWAVINKCRHSKRGPRMSPLYAYPRYANLVNGEGLPAAAFEIEIKDKSI